MIVIVGEMPDGIVKPADELAELVEDTIFKKFKETNAKYKNQVRSRVFNLKVGKCPALYIYIYNFFSSDYLIFVLFSGQKEPGSERICLVRHHLCRKISDDDFGRDGLRHGNICR